jgi:hypothetical protein
MVGLLLYLAKRRFAGFPVIAKGEPVRSVKTAWNTRARRWGG